jgi:mono/diheme cytochrome c family protein
MSRRTVRALVPLLGVFLVGCDLPGKPKPSERFQRPEEVHDFATLYGQNCAGCHGADGKLGPAPPLNDPLFRAIVPAEELEMVVSGGRPGTPMPAFAKGHGGSLTPLQVQVLVMEIKGKPYRIPSQTEEISPKWGVPPAAGEDVPTYVRSGEKPDRTTAGLEQVRTTVFARACAGCHGERGQGGKHHGQPVGAINAPAFLALISDQALRRLIITGRPDLGMPDYAEAHGRGEDYQPLTSAEIDQLVALLASWRQRPEPGER